MFDLVQIPALNDNYVYLLHDPESAATVAVDPALAEPVLDALRDRGWALTHIFCTHHHFDHVGGIEALKAATGAKVVGASADRARIPHLDMAVQDNDTVWVGGLRAQVLETPGHTSGHVCYWFHGESLLFCGDTLFSLGCGRLFEGTAQQMWESLSRLAALPDETQVCCAHEYTLANGRFALAVDPQNGSLLTRLEQVRELRAQGLPTVPSTMKMERETNPFLRAGNAAHFADLRLRKDQF